MEFDRREMKIKFLKKQDDNIVINKNEKQAYSTILFSYLID